VTKTGMATLMLGRYDHGAATRSRGGADTIRARPTVRRIGLADLKDALARGLADFSAIPTHAVFLCLIYPIVGLVLARAILGYALLPLLFPLAAGFALVGPFAAIGFYELSRRREQGLDISWEDAFDVLHSPSRDAIAALGFLLLVIFAIWIGVAQATYIANFGYEPVASIPHFIRQVFTTPSGWMLIIVGNFVGFLFAVTVLIVSVVAFPLLVDREVGSWSRTRARAKTIRVRRKSVVMRRSFRPRCSPARTSSLRDNRSGGAHSPSPRYSLRG
jgi:uncharacterized membrane protein